MCADATYRQSDSLCDSFEIFARLHCKSELFKVSGSFGQHRNRNALTRLHCSVGNASSDRDTPRAMTDLVPNLYKQVDCFAFGFPADQLTHVSSSVPKLHKLFEREVCMDLPVGGRRIGFSTSLLTTLVPSFLHTDHHERVFSRKVIGVCKQVERQIDTHHLPVRGSRSNRVLFLETDIKNHYRRWRHCHRRQNQFLQLCQFEPL